MWRDLTVANRVILRSCHTLSVQFIPALQLWNRKWEKSPHIVQLWSKSCCQVQILNPGQAQGALPFAGLEESPQRGVDQPFISVRIHSRAWICPGSFRPSSVKSLLADFAWEHRQEAVEFVAVGLCCSVEGEELRKASLVLEACLPPLCTVPVSSVHSLLPQTHPTAKLWEWGEGRNPCWWACGQWTHMVWLEGSGNLFKLLFDPKEKRGHCFRTGLPVAQARQNPASRMLSVGRVFPKKRSVFSRNVQHQQTSLKSMQNEGSVQLGNQHGGVSHQSQ